MLHIWCGNVFYLSALRGNCLLYFGGKCDWRDDEHVSSREFDYDHISASCLIPMAIIWKRTKSTSSAKLDQAKALKRDTECGDVRSDLSDNHDLGRVAREQFGAHGEFGAGRLLLL